MEKRLIVVTLELQGDRDVCALRRLLKQLLRGYQLKCVALGDGKPVAGVIENESVEVRK